MGIDLGALVTGSTVVIETTAGTWRFPVRELGEGEPSPVLTLLKPRISVVTAAGASLVDVAPYGDPKGAPPYGLVLGLIAALGLVFLLWRMFR
jgi:hypothetical protein